MAKIQNTTKANIHVTTEAGDFVFKAGESLELADDRAAMVADKGAVYFTVGELVADADFSAQKTDEDTESIASSATENAANEVKPVEEVKTAPAAVKTAVKTAPAAKK